MKVDKATFISYLNQQLIEQKNELVSEKESVNHEIGKETKSSAGDKFETSREMMNQERDRLEARIAYIDNHLKNLTEINTTSPLQQVNFGSLVQTNNGLFLFGLSIGSISYEGEKVFVLSLNSPIGKVFLGMKTKDEITFNEKSYTIQSIN